MPLGSFAHRPSAVFGSAHVSQSTLQWPSEIHGPLEWYFPGGMSLIRMRKSVMIIGLLYFSKKYVSDV